LTTAYLRYDPDFTGGYSASVNLWDAVSGLRIGEIMKHKKQVSTAFFDPTGKKILSLSSDSLVHIWDASSGKSIGPPFMFDGDRRNIRFTHDGKKIMMIGGDSILRCHDIFNRTPFFPPLKVEASVDNLSLSHNGKYLLILSLGESDDSIVLVDANTGRWIRSIKHGPFLWNAVFSKDDTKIMTSGGQEIKLWDIETGQQIGQTIAEDDEDSFNFHPVISEDNKYVIFSDKNNVARLWDLIEQRLVVSYMKNQAHLSLLDLSSDGMYALTAGGYSARVWRIKKKRSDGFVLQNGRPVQNALFSPDKQLILTAGADNTVQLWRTEPHHSLVSAKEYEEKVSIIAFSPDGKKFLTVTRDGTVYIRNSSADSSTDKSIHNEDEIYTAAFSPDGKYIVTGGRDNAVKIWEVTTGKLYSTLIHEGYVTSIMFSKDGKYMISSCEGKPSRNMKGSIRIWLTDTWKLAKPMITYKEGSVGGATFSLDCKYILAHVNNPSTGYHAVVWYKMTNPSQKFEVTEGAGSALFSPDGKFIATVDNNGIVRLWETATGKISGLAMKHNAPVNDICFSPDGSYIVTVGGNTAKFWQPGVAQQIGPTIFHHKEVNSVDFSKDGHTLLTGSSDSTCRIWNIEGDLDIPPELFKLQTDVITGGTFNLQTREVDFIQTEEWLENNWNKLNEKYQSKAKEHYKTCRYPEYNYWRRFYPEEASKIRPGINKD